MKKRYVKKSGGSRSRNGGDSASLEPSVLSVPVISHKHAGTKQRLATFVIAQPTSWCNYTLRKLTRWRVFHMCEGGSQGGWKRVRGRSLTPPPPGTHRTVCCLAMSGKQTEMRGWWDAVPPCGRCRHCRGNASGSAGVKETFWPHGRLLSCRRLSAAAANTSAAKVQPIRVVMAW